jgi:hypothetical protein
MCNAQLVLAAADRAQRITPDRTASIDNIDAGFTIGRTIAFGHAEERLARQQT